MFNLPEQPLASALNAVGAKTGLELFYDTNLVVHHRTHDLRGSLTVNEALSILLAGSGLVARSIAVGAVTIAPLQRERTGSQPQVRPDLSRHAAYFAVVQDGFAPGVLCAGRRDSDSTRCVALHDQTFRSHRRPADARLGRPVGAG